MRNTKSPSPIESVRMTILRAAAICLASSVFALNAAAAVPLSWNVDVTRVAPVTFDAYHGETLALEAVFKNASRPLDLTGKAANLFWQTNGMESVYWTTNAVVEMTDDGRAGSATLPGVVGASVPLARTNWVVRATFDGSMDPGSASVRGFLAVGETNALSSILHPLSSLNYRASFVIRFRPSPGFEPGMMTKPPPVLDFRHTEVINPPWPTKADYAATTTVMRAELKDYIDAQIEGAGLVTPQAVTNAAGAVTSNVVTKAYVEGLGIESGLDTNAVNFIIGEAVRTNYLCTLDAAMNRGSIYDPFEYLSINGCIIMGQPGSANTMTFSTGSSVDPGSYIFSDGKSLMSPFYPDGTAVMTEGRARSTFPIITNAYTKSQSDDRYLGKNVDEVDATYSSGSTVAKMRVMAKADNTPQLGYTRTSGGSVTADYDYYFPKRSGTVALKTSSTTNGRNEVDDQIGDLYNKFDQTASTVQTIGAHLNAEDARFVVTNYDSVVNVPEATVEVKINNTWRNIWKEMRRWNAFTGSNFVWSAWHGFHAWQTNVTAQLSRKAERAWGVYDSETGEYSPDGFTQISSSNILIAANMSYKRTVSTAGVWVLQCNSGVGMIGGDTNGYFRIKDGDGNTQFEIIKSNLREIGADAAGITVTTSGGNNVLTIPYSVVHNTHPTLKICTDLTAANWIAEGETGCAGTVTWSGSSGAYVATVTIPTTTTAAFVAASYVGGAEAIINNIAPTKLQYIYIGNTKYQIGYATINGTGVMTLTPQ